MTPQRRPGGAWSNIRELRVVNTASWVRIGLSNDAAPYLLEPEMPGATVVGDGDRLTLTLPADGPEVVHLRLAPGWGMLHLRADGSGRFGYDRDHRAVSFGAVTATVGERGTVELPVVDRLTVDNAGGEVNVRTVNQRCDVHATKGSVWIGDAGSAYGQLSAGELGRIWFERANPRNRTIVNGAERIRFADEEQRATSVDRARAAFERAPSQDGAEPAADEATGPAQGQGSPATRRSRRR